MAPATVYGGSVTTVSKGAAQRTRHRLPDVVLHGEGRKGGARKLPRDVRDYRRIEVDDGELRDRGLRAEAPNDTVDRERRQVVVAEDQDPAPHESVCLVQREDAAQLGLGRAMALVEIEPRRWSQP